MFTTFLFLIASVSLADTWERTLDKAMPSIVMIRSYAPRSFDGTTAGSSYATGFVVDAERGIILTNRHVVRPGPVVAEAILLNNEELPLAPLYRDPVHDFGFFKYDPEAIRFHEMEPLVLKPENARQGTEIRLAGSDAGEKISILAGTLARLDREAPSYGIGRYNDFNTFYFQAASSSSGGSSGSPVLDVNGYVVALNAGSNRRAASSFFLPLDRVSRALKLIQAAEPVPRGTIHTTLVHKTFDEAVRFGLSADVEATIREARPDAKGVLTVERVQHLGAAWERLEPGDILLSLGGELMTEFVPVEAHLDGNVGKMVFARILRGGVEQTVALQVGDLHAVTPSAYLEMGDSILHTTSYQTARHYEMPIVGAYVAKAGFLFNSKVERGEVITHINGAQIVNLDSLITAVEALADREIFRVHSIKLSEPERPRISTVKMDRRWFPAQRCERVDGERAWACEPLKEAPEASPVSPVTATPKLVQNKLARRIANGFVLVRFRIPYKTHGAYEKIMRGVGVIVDAEEGLVLVDRDTVTAGLGDVSMRFASSLEVDAEVVALHPQHNLALVRYDPKSIGDTPVSEVLFDGKPPKADDKVLHIGITGDETVAVGEVTVAGTQSWAFPMASTPFFRQVNLDYLTIKGSWSYFGGVLADKRGRPTGFVAAFPMHGEEGGHYARAIPAEVVNAFLEDPSGVKRVGVELGVERLVAARERGISDARAQELESHDKEKRQVLFVTRVTRDGPAYGVLEPGDIILSVNGSPATRMSDWNNALTGSVVDLVVFRGASEQSFSITPRFLSSAPAVRALKWGGAMFQAPYRAVAEQRGQPLDGVYVCYRWHGSPAGRFGLRPQRRVISVDGIPTPDLDSFSDAVVGKRSGEAVRVTTVDLKGRKRMITMEADTEYWPLVELIRTDSGWERRSVHPEAGGDTDAAGGSDVHR